MQISRVEFTWDVCLAGQFGGDGVGVVYTDPKSTRVPHDVWLFGRWFARCSKKIVRSGRSSTRSKGRWGAAGVG